LLKFIEKYKIYVVYFPLFLYWLLIFTLTTLPSSKLPEVKINDKIEHFLAYFGLSVLLGLTLFTQNKSKLLKKAYYIISVFIVAFYGAVDEIHQLYVPGRFCDINDWLADFVGAIIGSIVVYLFIYVSKVKGNKEYIS